MVQLSSAADARCHGADDAGCVNNPVIGDDLAELADAHGVSTRYEGSDRTVVDVDPVIVVAVLAQLGVDASSPAAIRRELVAAEESRRRAVLPPTIVLTEGVGRTLPVPARLVLEDGGELVIDGHLPDDLPLGWHRVVTDEQDVALIVVPHRLPDVVPSWGWMIQLYALRSSRSWGMGDFGDLAEVADRSTREQGAGVLLVSPVQAVTPTHPIERSPYSPSSRRFANPLYLRVTDTAAFAAADEETRARVLALVPENDTRLIDHDAVWDSKIGALELLWPHRPQHERDASDEALHAFATFCALAEAHGGDWRTWPVSLHDPDGDAVRTAAAQLSERVAFHAWLQLLCAQQLDAARAAGRAAGMSVGLVHDLPVGVHPGGADAWLLRDVLAPAVRVGCPADAFNSQGQDWDLPPWRPDALAAAGYAPFRDVVRRVLSHADGIRVDHIAGMWRLWWIPPGEPAHRGTYVRYDAEAMVGILLLEAHRAGAIVVGEDLGTVEQRVTDVMHDRGILSSAVLWFERDWEAPGQPHVRPQEWEPATMASISTHDLPTAAGWLAGEGVRLRAELGLIDGSLDEELLEASQNREALAALLRQEGLAGEDPVVALHALIARAASRLVLSSPADAIAELRQPNLPGTVEQYPNWRIPLPVDLDGFFTDPGVRAAVAPLRESRPPR